MLLSWSRAARLEIRLNNPSLTRDALGHLVFTDEAGTPHIDVHAVRAFPITAPNDGISLMDQTGKELRWFASLTAIPESDRVLIMEELAAREFMPVIERIIRVSNYATPSIWQIQTDRGETRLRLNGEENIRRVAGNTLLISDANGVQYLVRHSAQLDKQSRRLLDRFL
jgi:hypothetical protein